MFQNDDNSTGFSIDNSYNRYDYTLHSLEIPLEYRWRTSTPTNNSFWRVYTGVSYKYTLQTSTSFDDIGGNTTRFENISELNQNNFTNQTRSSGSNLIANGRATVDGTDTASLVHFPGMKASDVDPLIARYERRKQTSRQ